MLKTDSNSDFSQAMDLFNEIEDISDLFSLDKNFKLDSVVEEHKDLQSKYSSLNENYTREIDNSKKVEKCLLKCLKFYSKLCKKYEAQQKLIKSLEENIKEKIICLEEARKNEEKMQGLIAIYKIERQAYSGETKLQLKKEKELLLDICCKLIGESVRSSSIRNLTQLFIRKFKKDLDYKTLNILKEKLVKPFEEWDICESSEPHFTDFKNETEVKSEEKISSEVTKVEIKELKEDTEKYPLDLSFGKKIAEESDEFSNEDIAVETQKNVPVSSPPSSEKLPVILETCDSDSDSDDSVDYISDEEKSDLDSSDNREKSDIHPESFSKSSSPPPSTSVIKEFSKPPTEWVGKSSSIFDISDSCIEISNFKEVERQESTVVKLEEFSGICFESEVKSLNLNVDESKEVSTDSKEDSVFPYDKELCKIFREMCSFRSLSPLRACTNLLISSKTCTDTEKVDTKDSIRACADVQKVDKEDSSKTCVDVPKVDKKDSSKTCGDVEKIDKKDFSKTYADVEKVDKTDSSKTCANVQKIDKKESQIEKPKSCLKRNSNGEENPVKGKKSKTEEEQPNCNLLDSILSAMSIQNEEFKTKEFKRKEVECGESSCESQERPSPSKRTCTRSESSKENSFVRQSLRQKEASQRKIEKLVTEEIKKFVASPISSKEEADKNVKHCISVLSKYSEDVIVKSVVGIVLENVDEAVEIFERPSPPLTKTQHRLIVLLSVFRTLDSNFQNIFNKILSVISEKLFPDNFFWPDDSVESATRFYAALCRAKNDPKTLWKFCIEGMTEMRQRCPLLMLSVLKTWPDILHDASTLKNNLLAVTVVNVFLHMPKKEGLRNFNQSRKLVALKHLLINFYQFKVEDTIEGYTKKILDAVFREVPGSEKSIVLLSKCRDQDWTMKNVLPTLKSKLDDWAEDKVKDSVATGILSVIKQISPTLQEESVRAELKDVGVCLSKILISGNKSHESEVRIIETLLKLKQYPQVRKAIREWIPKNPIDDGLRNEIINVSAENILRELKLNRKKEPKRLIFKKKLKKQPKKSKKKKKGKKPKTSVGVSS